MTQTHTPDPTAFDLASNLLPTLTPPTDPTAPGGFTYAAVPPALAEKVRASTDRIRACTKALADRILDIGAELERVKILLGHGQFGPWLAAEFGWSERTAQRYMQVHTVLGAKSDTVSGLEAGTLYQLSARSTPEATRTAIVARIEAGERPTPAAIKAEIAAARKEATGLKALKAKVRQDWVQSVPPSAPSVARAREAAAILVERFGEDRAALRTLLDGVDANALLAALRGGRGPGQPIASVEL